MTQAQIDEAFDAWWISQHPHPPLPEQRDQVARAHAWFRLGVTGESFSTATPVSVVEHTARLDAYEAGKAWSRSRVTP